MAALPKLLVVLGVFGVLLSILLYIPVSPDLAEPWTFRIINGMFMISLGLGKLCETIGLGTGMGITRYLCDAVIRLPSPVVGPELVEREDTSFDGIPVRIYRPKKSSKSPRAGFVYYHGGGWILGSVASHDGTTALYAVEADVVVVSVEYRLSPEYHYPIPLDDCVVATEYFIKNAAKFNVDPKRIAVGGDSAGGNLAASVPLMLRNKGFQPMPRAQVLIYPVLQLIELNTPSFFIGTKQGVRLDSFGMMSRMYLDLSPEYANLIVKNRHISPQTRKKYSKFLPLKAIPESLIPKDYQPTDPREWDDINTKESEKRLVDQLVSPLLAEVLSNLPEALIVTMGTDVLRDDGAMFAYRLRKAGVKTDWQNFPSSFHGSITATNGPLGTETGRQVNGVIIKFLKSL